MMDTWESFFREKSRRRWTARLPALTVLGWSLAAVVYLVLVVGLLKLIGL
jgi:hypothetical protein